jgi:rubrerythrin
MNDKDNFLENHVSKCRCCFESFDDGVSSVKITKPTERLFFEVTQVELKSSSGKYSQKICLQCNSELKQFGKLRKEWIRKQKKLYELTERDNAKSRPTRKREKKLSADIFNETSFDEERSDLFVKLEVKQERDEPDDESCVVLEPHASISMMPFVKLEKIKIDESSHEPTMPDHIYESDNGRDSKRDLSDYDDDDDGVDDPFDEFFKKQVKSAKKNTYKRKKDRKIMTKHFCPHCTRFFHTEDNLKVHIDVVHFKLKNYKCTKCDFKTYSPAFLRGHDSRVHSGVPYVSKPKEPKKPCPICGLLVQKISTHTRNVHIRPKNVFCDICGFGIFNLNRLRRHMHKHLSKEEKHQLSTFVCDLCGAQVHSKNSIKSHIKNVHQETGNQYKCYCGRSYKAESYLKIHQKSHEKK